MAHFFAAPRRLIATVAAFVAMPCLAEGAFTGTWKLVANGYPGVMEIRGNPGSYTGRFKYDAHGAWEEMLELRISGSSISFLRAHATQRYTGTLMGGRIAGTFDQGGAGNYAWQADRSSAESSTFAGSWKLVANGYAGILEIHGGPGAYAGRFKYDAHGVWEEMLELHIRGNSISFLRAHATQRYQGTLVGGRITGNFNQGGAGNYTWQADRVSNGVSETSSFTRSWKLVANGYKGVLEINGGPGAYKGRFKFDVHGAWEDMLELRINGNSISFLRALATQRYKGTLTGGRITGTFDQGGAGRYPWQAE